MSIIVIPSYPPAPASVEFTLVSAAGISRSPFTGQQQVTDWNNSWMEASVNWPPMTDAVAQNWIVFLQQLKGVVNVFQFSAAFCAAYPASLNTASPPGPRYWRLKENSRKYSIAQARLYGIQFDVREAR